MERYLRVNVLGPGLRLMKKRIYRAAVSQRLRNSALYILKMVAAGCSAALVSSYRTHEASSQNTGVFIDLAQRNWNLTRCSVSETGKGPPGHGDKRRRLSRHLYTGLSKKMDGI